MKRIIVTGLNGTGKSHFARRLAAARPDLTLISFDEIRLARNWVKRPSNEINCRLSEAIASDSWILEGGPNLLESALPSSDVLVWLDPPELIRAWRLALRPWRNLGKTRSEIPSGNIDWPIEQYRFAFQSLKRRNAVRSRIQAQLQQHSNVSVWHCRRQNNVEAAWAKLAAGA